MSPGSKSRRRRRGPALLLLLAAAPAALADQIPFSEFIGLRRGMSESELLLRAGPPDLVTEHGDRVVERLVRGFPPAGHGGAGLGPARITTVVDVRKLHYVPGPREHDPYLTVITLRGGAISEIRRTKVFSRAGLPRPPPDPVRRPPPRTDAEVEIDRVEATLEAAREYAEIRRRLKSGRPAAAPPVDVHHERRSDGSVWFGDRPAPPEEE